MRSDDAKKVIAMLNSSWGTKPLDALAASVWSAELMKHPMADVLRVLTRLLTTHKWRPSLAELLEPLRADPEKKSVYAAFETVCEAIGRQSKRGGLNDIEERAVRRLGGWPRLGEWQLDQRHWQFKAFKEVYDDLVEGEGREGLRAIAGGQQRALRGTE